MQLEDLRKEMVAAMKAKDKTRKETISSLVSAVKKLAIDEGCREDVPQELVTRAVLKEMKTMKEQIDTCPDDRVELKEEYLTRFNIIREFAPSMMEAEEVKAFIQEKFSDILATKNKGQVMKAVMPELKGKADGKVINEVVAQLCE